MPTRRLAALVLTSLLAAGCAAPKTPVHIGPALPASELAIVQAQDPENTGGATVRFHLAFESFMKVGDGQRTFVGDARNGYPTRISVLPGDYTIITRCVSGNYWAYPAAELSLEAGRIYTLRCGVSPHNLTSFRLTMDSIE